MVEEDAIWRVYSREDREAYSRTHRLFKGYGEENKAELTRKAQSKRFKSLTAKTHPPHGELPASP